MGRNTMKKLLSLVLAVMALMGLLSFNASATTILVDFDIGWKGSGTGSGAFATPSNYVDTTTGNHWNYYLMTQSASSTITLALVDSTGLSSGITLSAVSQGNKMWGGNTGVGSLATGVLPDWVTKAYVVGSSAERFTLTGLTAGEKYSFSFYGYTTTTTATSDAITVASGSSTQSLTYNPKSSYTTLALISDITADSSGKATITMSVGSGSTIWTLSAFEIASVPEPSTYALLVAGGLFSLAGVIHRSRKA